RTSMAPPPTGAVTRTLHVVQRVAAGLKVQKPSRSSSQREDRAHGARCRRRRTTSPTTAAMVRASALRISRGERTKLVRVNRRVLGIVRGRRTADDTPAGLAL